MRNFEYLTVIFATLTLFTTTCFAHDTPADDTKPEGWQKSVALGFSLTDGNSNSTLLNFNAQASLDDQPNLWRFELNGNYGENEDSDTGKTDTTHEDVRFDGNYKRLLNDRWFVGLGSSFLYDDVADVDYRVTIDPNVGYFLIREDDLRLSLETGPSYVFEKLDGVSDDYAAWRVADRFEWDVSENAKLFQFAEYLVSFEDADDYLVNAEFGAEAAIYTNLSLVATVRNSYDNTPAEGNERNDVAVVTGLRLAL